MSDLIEQFKAARKVGTPVLAVQSPDQFQTLVELCKVNGVLKGPVVKWDLVNGMEGINPMGRAVLEAALGDMDPVSATRPPADALDMVDKKFPGIDGKTEGTTLFMVNIHRFLDPPTMDGAREMSQAIHGVRDRFKSQGKTLVLLAPRFIMPPELSDVLVLDEPLPTAQQLEEIAKEEYKEAKLEPTPEELVRAVDGVRSLAAFEARQAFAMSLSPRKGMDWNGLWTRKRTSIAATPGLSVYRGGETFADVAGSDNVKFFLDRLMKGKRRIRAIGFADEIEKMLAGATGGDLSGTSQEQHGIVLKEMQDNGYIGVIFLGPPGSGKSAIAKAVGPQYGRETIIMDLPLMKGSLVGETAARTSLAFKKFRAMCDGDGLIIATCNSIDVLSPELRRRFPFLFFFDLPVPVEKEGIWNMYLQKYELDPKQERPVDANWTGAEIRNCNDIAFNLNIPLVEAARFIVPVAVSSKASIDKLRNEADGKYISAYTPGIYRKADFDTMQNAAVATGRVRRDGNE